MGKKWLKRNPRRAGLLIALCLWGGFELLGHAAYFIRHGGVFLWQDQRTERFTPYGLIEYLPNKTIPGTVPRMTDVNGFLHNGYDRAIAEDRGKFLIFLLGGSTVAGLGVANDQTAAAQLEKMLNARRPGRFRVVNAGVHGFFSYQQVSFLAGNILQRYRPDMVIALDGRNDALYAASFKDWAPNWQPHYSSLAADVNRLAAPRPLAGDIHWLSRVSIVGKTFRWLRWKLHPRSQTPPDRMTPPDQELLAKAAAAYFANHAAAQARSAALGIPYFGFIQPTLLGSLKEDISAVERAYMADYAKIYPRPGVYPEAFAAFYDALRRDKPAAGWLFDISGLFAGRAGEFYVDSCHYSAEGNRLIAAEIARLLAGRLKL